MLETKGDLCLIYFAPDCSLFRCSSPLGSTLWCLIFIYEYIYRTRAISGRSQLVAAPLRNHAKRQFLWVFYVII